MNEPSRSAGLRLSPSALVNTYAVDSGAIQQSTNLAALFKTSQEQTKSSNQRERLTAQERSGLSVKEFCKERGLGACTVYAWRNRLRGEGAVRFALVDRGGVGQEPAAEVSLELVLATGERLSPAAADAQRERVVLCPIDTPPRDETS